MAPSSLGAVRRAVDADEEEIENLLRVSLGIGPDRRYSAFLSWKHDSNPFGRSPAWVLLDAGEIVGVRVFLRWVFRVDGSEQAIAIRAVDTATAPTHRGKGVFTTLTMAALEDLRSEVD